MRSFPSCWNKTLAQLGFKRKRRKTTQRNYMRRRSLFECLEPRQMLAVDSFTVDVADDINDGDYSAGNLSLREALIQAAADTDLTTIDFAPGIDEILLGGTQLTIDSNVAIDAPGKDQLTIDAQLNSRVFQVNAGISATIEGLTITGGSVTSGAGILNYGDLTLDGVVVQGNYATNGAGIYVTSTGTLEISNSTIDDNHATNRGGGITEDFGTGSSLTISNSTFSNNISAGVGGGLDLRSATSGVTPLVSITNSTFSGNDGTSAGAIWIGGGAAATEMTIVNTTITDNHATAATGKAGGIFNSGTVTLHNTILAGNTAGNTAYHNGVGDLGGTGSSYNLIGIDFSGIGITDSVDGNMVGTLSVPIDPGLAALANYNGPTKTHALFNDSPALDRGSDSYGGSYDQRMHARPIDLSGVGNEVTNITDIGAFEAGNASMITVWNAEDQLNLTHAFDSEDLSLREAINWANTIAGPHEIHFVDSYFNTPRSIVLSYDGDASGAPDQLSIEDDLMILGSGAEFLSISGGNVTGVFTVSQDQNVTLQGITVRDGIWGGILNMGNLTLQSVVVRDNSDCDGPRLTDTVRG